MRRVPSAKHFSFMLRLISVYIVGRFWNLHNAIFNSGRKPDFASGQRLQALFEDFRNRLVIAVEFILLTNRGSQGCGLANPIMHSS